MPAVLWKEIKPGRFNERAFVEEIGRRAELVADGMLLDFLLTVSQWEHEPKFDKEVSVGPNSVDILVGTDDQIYRYVSEGTKAHPIRVKNAKALHFQAGYNAKTMPGVISSKAGGAFGDDVFALEVQHPGTEARKFEETIAKKWRPRFQKEMQAAMKDAARASGHGVP
jgi:hypothetical protein